MPKVGYISLICQFIAVRLAIIKLLAKAKLDVEYLLTNPLILNVTTKTETDDF